MVVSCNQFLGHFVLLTRNNSYGEYIAVCEKKTKQQLACYTILCIVKDQIHFFRRKWKLCRNFVREKKSLKNRNGTTLIFPESIYTLTYIYPKNHLKPHRWPAATVDLHDFSEEVVSWDTIGDIGFRKHSSFVKTSSTLRTRSLKTDRSFFSLMGFPDQSLVTFEHVTIKRFSSDLVFACDSSLPKLKSVAANWLPVIISRCEKCEPLGNQLVYKEC